MKFNFLTWNTHGDNQDKADDLETLINDYHPDIITLQETALIGHDSEIENRLTRLGYRVIRGNVSPNKAVMTAFNPEIFIHERSVILAYDSPLSLNPKQPGAPDHYRRPLYVNLRHEDLSGTKIYQIINSYNTTGTFAGYELDALCTYVEDMRGKIILAGDFNFSDNFARMINADDYTWYHNGIDYVVVKTPFDVNHLAHGRLTSDHEYLIVEITTND